MMESHYCYIDHLYSKIGVTLDFITLKIKRSVDSVFMVFKDDPEICAALNGNIKNFTQDSIFEYSTS